MSYEPGAIVDTIVLLYFLLAGADGLLRDLIGAPILVPRTVYDPDERTLGQNALRKPQLLSEMRQAVRHYETATGSSQPSEETLRRVRRVDALFDEGDLHVIDLTDDERQLAARLQARSEIEAFKLRAPLGPGEASCVAIAHYRKWTLVTDDQAALDAMAVATGKKSFPYERIRRLLKRAVSEELIPSAKADAVHAEMRRFGFWDEATTF